MYFCELENFEGVLTNDMLPYQWSPKFDDNNTVLKDELTVLHDSVKYASQLQNRSTFKIHKDNRASITASSNKKSANQENSKKNIQNSPINSKNKCLLE
ncbi:hypothetical protein AVEN_32265-1 [Araneus ventricosus]|uniref:RNase H type-1 domain-containing protein n=1 Tax=Araneus ventricosus TaxID=182803 RepID=A0A4Y2J398_ARAVE|nr:hypothetical protein AVEN_32265-1 [Araneus ventricosus]